MSLNLESYIKSSKCDVNGSCVEAKAEGAHTNGAEAINVRIRDTKEAKLVGGTALTLVLSSSDWSRLIGLQQQGSGPAEAAVARAPFAMDLEGGGVFAQVPQDNEFVWVDSRAPDKSLHFTTEEIVAWGAGADEFRLAT